MTTTVYLDTNALIMLSGLNENLPELSKYVSDNHIELSVGQVQIDENIPEEKDFNQKIERALKKLKTHGIAVTIEPTIETVVGVSRVDYCKVGSDELSKIDDLLRSEIELCERKPKKKLNVARDALIALSSLNHNYFITTDKCLYRSWKKVIKENQENSSHLQKNYSIPSIIHCNQPRGVLNAIISEIKRKN